MKTTKYPFYYNAPQSTMGKARFLRLNLTSTEKVLWEELRAGKIENCKFRRQHPVGPYITDFYSHEVKLAVEADGEIHDTKDQKQYDELRNEFCTDREITVLRFTNFEIDNNIKAVREKIRETIIYLRLLKVAPSS